MMLSPICAHPVVRARSQEEAKKVVSTPLELNLLAFMFTAVKILYTSGAVQVLPELITLIGESQWILSRSLASISFDPIGHCVVASLRLAGS